MAFAGRAVGVINAYLQKYLPGLTAAEREKLCAVARLLAEKNKVMNLTAITDEKGIALLHIYDSLSLLQTGLFAPGRKIIDIGCGGGFPSLPLAVCLPECEITANDSTAKKLDFVRGVAQSTGLLNLKTLCGRAEELAHATELRGAFDIAVSRGVARLNVLCEWCLPFVKTGGCFVAMKGEKGKEEAAEAQNAIAALGGGMVNIINITIPEYEYRHTLCVIKKLRETPQEYPRANGRIRKNPL
ncbi:MAG: 16S rRNA (guanine(527)-N(7))-methyltransferase RsmG [Clostridia bacterium]|nr:16S rRNA (guanine(527)-N(7))-methyltransferase RsmG [Clostridia bacterium]